MHKIGVIGDRDSILGLNTAIEARIVNKPRDAVKELKKMADEGFAVIYIVEEMAEHIAEEIDKYRNRMIPAIIPIPGIRGKTGFGIKSIKKSVEKAVGADILFKD